MKNIRVAKMRDKLAGFGFITFCLLPVFAQAQTQDSSSTFTEQSGVWTIKGHWDSFEAATVCKIYNGIHQFDEDGIVYDVNYDVEIDGSGMALVGNYTEFGRSVDAQVKIDDQKPFNYLSSFDTLSDRLNALKVWKTGRVPVPSVKLLGAHTIAIRTVDDDATTINIVGLNAAWQVATDHDCRGFASLKTAKGSSHKSTGH